MATKATKPRTRAKAVAGPQSAPTIKSLPDIPESFREGAEHTCIIDAEKLVEPLNVIHERLTALEHKIDLIVTVMAIVSRGTEAASVFVRTSSLNGHDKEPESNEPGPEAR
jgi:hypothetical protein